MEISEKLLKFKYPIILALTLSLILSCIIFIPSFLTILTYFWPLFLSTALFLVAVIFFGKTSAHPGGSESPAVKAGEGLLDYVAGQPELTIDSYKSE
ncbi:hypothetical protein REPUB_Repub18cG0009000 [Reevesia pubescens]